MYSGLCTVKAKTYDKFDKFVWPHPHCLSFNNDVRPCDKVGERGGKAPFLLNRLSTFEWYCAINRFKKYPPKVRRSFNFWRTTRRKTGFTNQLKYLITKLNSFYLSCKLNTRCSYKEIIDLPCTLVLKMLDRNKRLNCNLR